jgi:hypothetical protein
MKTRLREGLGREPCSDGKSPALSQRTRQGRGSQLKIDSTMKRILVAVAFAGLLGVAWAQLNEGPEAKLDFLVIKDDNGKPVRNAGVVMHPVSKGKQSRGGYELKTDSDGKASFDGVPYGPLRVQVLAPGYQTFGDDYQVDKPLVQITVKLKRPQKQYSIYDEHPEDKKDDQKKPEEKPQ